MCLSAFSFSALSAPPQNLEDVYEDDSSEFLEDEGVENSEAPSSANDSEEGVFVEEDSESSSEMLDEVEPEDPELE